MSIVYSKKRKRIQPINDLWEEPLQIKIWPITLTFSHSSSHSGTKKDSQRVTFVLSKMILLILSFLAVNLFSCFHEEFFKVRSKYCEYYPHIVCVRTYEIDTCWVRIDLHFLYPFLYQFSFFKKCLLFFEYSNHHDCATMGQLQILMDGGCP